MVIKKKKKTNVLLARGWTVLTFNCHWPRSPPCQSATGHNETSQTCIEDILIVFNRLFTIIILNFVLVQYKVSVVVEIDAHESAKRRTTRRRINLVFAYVNNKFSPGTKFHSNIPVYI